MLNCADHGQIQKYKTHAYKTLKTAGVQMIILKHPTTQLKKNSSNNNNIKPKYRVNVHIKKNPIPWDGREHWSSPSTQHSHLALRKLLGITVATPR